MSASKPTLSEVLNLAISGALAQVRVALPGTIVAFDRETQRAEVQISIKDRHTEPDGSTVAETLAVLSDVPVQYTATPAFGVKFPIRKGDPVLLVFASSSIARLKAGARGPVDPGDDRHHALPDAVALIGAEFRPGHEPPSDDLEIYSTGLIIAGGNQPLVTKAEFDSHTHLIDAIAVVTTHDAGSATGTSNPPTDPITGTPKLRG